MNPSSNATPPPKKKHPIKKIIIAILLFLAAAYATLATLNREPDPSHWEGLRSGYKNTK